MIRGLLVDLDDTLLANDTSRFLPAYFQRLSVSFPGQAAPEDVLTQVLRATKRMMENRNPFQTLKETFDQAFYPALGLDVDAARPGVEAFYRDVFPELRSLTAPLPGAAELVQAVRDLGLSLVVATNPMMPSTAVEQRLEWAGLPVSARFFSLLTTYETFHFAKPDPAYVAEILGRMGWRAAEAALIGNDPTDDLQPAALLGLPVFHIGGGSDDGLPGGDHVAAIEWLRSGPWRARSGAEANPQAIEARLRGQAAALDALTRGLTADDWHRRPAGGLRSPVEIVCHLRDVEGEVTLPRLQLLVQQANPFLPAPDTARWVTDRGYDSQSGPEALAALRRLRLQLLDEVRTLAPNAWSRTGRHALLGPTTLAEVMSTAAEHEIVHLANLKDALVARTETA
jgi:FMN phosphatase YigB (HAD superfamily)